MTRPIHPAALAAWRATLAALVAADAPTLAHDGGPLAETECRDCGSRRCIDGECIDPRAWDSAHWQDRGGVMVDHEGRVTMGRAESYVWRMLGQ